MTRLTIAEIQTHYPDQILIESVFDEGEGKWASIMYMLRDRRIHKTMLSFHPIFSSEQEASERMHEIAQWAMTYEFNPE